MHAGLGDDGLPRHVLKLEVDHRVLHTGRDEDLRELGGPGVDDVQDNSDFPAREGSDDGTVVEVRQAGRCHLLQRRHLGCDCGEHEGFSDSKFIAGETVCDIGVAGVGSKVVLLKDQRAELVVPELLAEDEAAGSVVAQLVVAGEQVVEGVADGEDRVDAHRASLVDEHGFHDLERSTLALHDRGKIHQGIDQSRREREGQFEAGCVGGLVVLAGVHAVEQDVHRVGPRLQFLEGTGELHLRGVAERAQQALLRDHREVAAAERDVVEAAFLVFEGLAAGLDLTAGVDGGVFPGGEVVLAGDEGDDGDGELSVPGFHQQRELLGLVVEGLG